MADIKGRVLLDTLAAIRERGGEQQLSKVIKGLGSESKKYLNHQFSSRNGTR